MNERIRELAEQVYGTQATEQEIKFAELIVQKCIQAVKNVGGYNEDYHMNAIKKYFGVEE
jgi:hypothetical protein